MKIYLPIAACLIGGLGRFDFFYEYDMMGKNIGKKNHVLAEAKIYKFSNCLINYSLNFDFSESHPCKVKKIKNHQNSKCDFDEM